MMKPQNSPVSSACHLMHRLSLSILPLSGLRAMGGCYRGRGSALYITFTFLGLSSFAFAQEQLGVLRDNLSLPQLGLSILTSLAAVVGALLKGELRAESNHKDVLVPLHALLSAKDLTETSSLSRESAVWKLGIWLERKKGVKWLNGWCNTKGMESMDSCFLVDNPGVVSKLQISWFYFNCGVRLKLVELQRSHECSRCIRIDGKFWLQLEDCIPEDWCHNVVVLSLPQQVVLACTSHTPKPEGRNIVLSQVNIIAFPDMIRQALILLPLEKTEMQECVPMAFSSLDAQERDLSSPIISMLLQRNLPTEQAGWTTEWSVWRKGLALVTEIIIAIFLSWGAQMPPLSASLVGRRLVRSHATGARGQTSLMAATGNVARVFTEEGRICLIEVNTSIVNQWLFTIWTIVEMTMPAIAILLEYAIWFSVLIGWIPPLFGSTPKIQKLLLKTCMTSVTLSLCCFMCLYKNFSPNVPSPYELWQVMTILGFGASSQVGTWFLYHYLRQSHPLLQVASLAIVCSSFGELMWLAAMSMNAFHSTMSHVISWQRTLAHVAPYFTDAMAAIILAI